MSSKKEIKAIAAELGDNVLHLEQLLAQMTTWRDNAVIQRDLAYKQICDQNELKAEIDALHNRLSEIAELANALLAINKL